MEPTNATTWALLREQWLRMSNLGYGEDHLVMVKLKELLIIFKPVHIPNPVNDGDYGWVYFSDNSCIKWDWDNGDFWCEGLGRLNYPFYSNDPLDWEESHQISEV